VNAPFVSDPGLGHWWACSSDPLVSCDRQTHTLCIVYTLLVCVRPQVSAGVLPRPWLGPSRPSGTCRPLYLLGSPCLVRESLKGRGGDWRGGAVRRSRAEGLGQGEHLSGAACVMLHYASARVGCFVVKNAQHPGHMAGHRWVRLDSHCTMPPCSAYGELSSAAT
jgi:hypothetical protein